MVVGAKAARPPAYPETNKEHRVFVKTRRYYIPVGSTPASLPAKVFKNTQYPLFEHE